MPKLTLSVDAEVVRQAKRYAQEHGTSVSGIVEACLRALGGGAAANQTPVLRRLRGSLRNTTAPDYRRHLESKYL